MATQTLPVVRPSAGDYRELGNGRSVSPLLGTPDGPAYRTEYYPGVLLMQTLQEEDPSVYGLTSEQVGEMVEAGIVPEGEGTLTVVLFPAEDGSLSPRYMTRRGKPLINDHPSTNVYQ